MIEYRIGWAASSNASFEGTSDWMEWGGHEETVAEVEEALNASAGLSPGLEAALDLCGFEWWSEVRVVASDGQEDR